MILLSNLALTLIIVGCAVLALLIIGLIVLIICKRPKGVKIDDEFMNLMLESLGSKDNIKSYSVENSRVKFELYDVNAAKLDKLKELSPKGVFITNNTVKTLFKYESNQIVSNLNRIMK